MDKDLIDQICSAHAFDPEKVERTLEKERAAITHEMLAAHRSPAPRYFIDEIAGEYFMIPTDRRLDWYAFDQRMEDGHGPEPLPAYAHPVESLCHLEFALPEEPFV